MLTGKTVGLESAPQPGNSSVASTIDSDNGASSAARVNVDEAFVRGFLGSGVGHRGIRRSAVCRN